MALNLVGLWIALSTSYTFIYKHRDDSHRGGMKMSRAIPLTVAYLVGIAGGITLIQGSHWGMYIVTVCTPHFSSRSYWVLGPPWWALSKGNWM